MSINNVEKIKVYISVTTVKMKTCIFVVFVLALTQAFPQESKKSTKHGLEITGGGNAYPNQFPYQVGILTSVGRCGGSLIAPKYVLTAAHCLTYDNVVTLVFGAHNLTETKEPSQVRVQSDAIIRHEGYSSITTLNDIALIEMREPIEENHAIKIIPIANGSNLYTGKQGIISGWGETTNDQIFDTDVLKYVSTPIMSNEECGKADTMYPQFTGPTFMCTSGEGPVGACTGDSGNPLVVDGVLVGVVAYGPLECEEGMPTVHTRLTEYTSWITINTHIDF